MYVCWAVGRGGGLALGWARGGRGALAGRAALWARRAARAALAALALLGLVPLMFGLLLELVSIHAHTRTCTCTHTHIRVCTLDRTHARTYSHTCTHTVIRTQALMHARTHARIGCAKIYGRPIWTWARSKQICYLFCSLALCKLYLITIIKDNNYIKLRWKMKFEALFIRICLQQLRTRCCVQSG